MIPDLKQAIRSLGRWRWGAVVAIVTLAVGIGATTVVASLLRVFLVDFPGIAEPGLVARIYASSPALGVPRGPVAFGEYQATLAQARSFEAIGAYVQEEVALGSQADDERVAGGYATPGFFRALGATASVGRTFSEADAASSQPVALMIEPLWRRLFPDGRVGHASIKIDGVDHLVIGVMPRHFDYGFIGMTAQVWLPLSQTAAKRPAIVSVFARLRPGLTWTAAKSELDALGRARAAWTWRAIPLLEDSRTRAIGALTFTMLPAIVILLIVCLNVACMLMARGVERDKELSVRRALGATRARIVRTLSTENLLLAVFAGLLGSALAAVVLRILAARFAAVQPALAERITVDGSLLPLALGCSFVACVLFGTIPALRLSRRDVAASLNGVPPRYRVNIAGYGARDLIVFVELGSAVGLVVLAAMLFNLFSQIAQVKRTFPSEHVVAVHVQAGGVDLAKDRIAAIAGVSRATVAGSPPGRGIPTWRSGPAQVEVDGGSPIPMSQVTVDPDFFDTIGLPVLRGRTFDNSERNARSGVVILTESAAKMLVRSADALGAVVRITARGESLTATVIGVCRDPVDYGRLTQGGVFPPDFYVPYVRQAAGDAAIFARVPGDPHLLVRRIAAAARPPNVVRSPETVVIGDLPPIGDGLGTPIVLQLLAGFGVVALLLAASGIFAVISQSVAHRTTEFGIRLALGAAPRRVLTMVLARETKLIGAAILAGAAFTVGVTHSLFVELARLSATAPTLWLVVGTLCGGVAAVAVGFATYRIIRLEPAAVLRRH